MRTSAKRRLLAIVALLGTACGGDDAPGDSGDGGVDISDLAYAACPAAERIGGFEVVRTDAFTGVQGQVYDRTLPSSVPTTAATVGSCKLVSAPNHACTPTCAARDVCTAQQTCVPYPTAQNVGNVDVAGLREPVAMAAREPTFFYAFTGTLPNPGYTAGAGLRVSAAGGNGAAFTLRGVGVEALLLGETTYVIEDGVDLPITWTPPAVASIAKVTISLNINGHGLVGSHVECTVDDTGAYTLPGALITQLVSAGTSGFPTITVTRISLDATTIDAGCVDFRVRASVKLDVTIPGVQSCQDDTECTAPATCRGDLTCG